MFRHPVLFKGVGFPIALALAVACSLPCLAATPEEVDKAIKKGQQYLYSKEGKDGTWELVSRPELGTDKDQKVTDLKARQWGGLTAIATYALLASGENAQEPKIASAVAFLQKANIQSTYGIGLSSQVWLLVPHTQETRAVMARDVKMLDLGMTKKGDAAGFYGYWTGTKHGSDSARWSDASVGYVGQPTWAHDLSNSQYAVLGMWALDEAGAEVSSDYWKKVEDAWKKAQQPDGGWRYGPDREVTASMTAAGIATLFITQDYTLVDRWGGCRGGAPSPNIDKGLAWMDHQINQVIEEGNLYTMYGIERIGTASGRKYFGPVDWYQKGADMLVHRQGGDGNWGGDIPNTCFALLFLARGRAPVMMNKLIYDTPHAAPGVVNVWNERPRDVADLAHWSSRQLERDLNWQTVNLEVSPEELHDAPILYLSGSQGLAFSPEKVQKLRTFVEQGGLILGNADCAKPEFSQSFTELGAALFPKYEFRELPPNHTIFIHEQYVASKWRVRPKVMGLSNGVRELMLLIPDADPSRAWQSRNDRTKQEAFELGADIFLYSIDKKNLLNKGQTYIVQMNPAITATKKIKLARLITGENSAPEPGGWRRMAAILHNQDKIDLEVVDVKPGEGNMIASRVAHLTGTTALTLTDSARLEIKSFVQQGGTLIVDAAGGSTEFARSAEAQLNTIFGPAAKELEVPIPLNSPVYNQPGMEKIDSAGFRMYARASLLRGAKTPMLRGITFNKRIRVFYSALDLSAGIVGEPVDGVYGYDPATATTLMAAMVRYGGGK